MIDRQKMIIIAEKIRKKCCADDYIIRISAQHDHLVRFARNGITQHIGGDKLRISLKVAFDNKTGSASINQSDSDSLDQLIKSAESIARINKPDPEYIKTATAQQLPKVDNFDRETSELNEAAMIDRIKLCIDNARKLKAQLAGIAEKHHGLTYLTTRNGFEGFDRDSSYAHSMTIQKDEIETKVSRSAKAVDEIDMNSLIDQLNNQLASLEKPQAMNIERIPVIMRPPAVLNWLIFLFWILDRRSADEGVSPFTDQLNKKCFGDNFTIRSVLDDSALSTPPFNWEGISTQPTTWVEQGILKNMPVTRYYAQKIGIEPVFVFNFDFKGDNSSEAEMMKSVPRGLIINNLWYIRQVDRKTGEMTGLTRDGVMYFEDGKIIRSVNNFRWNEILHEMTKRIISLGPSVPQETYARIPTLLIDAFNLVDSTTF